MTELSELGRPTGRGEARPPDRPSALTEPGRPARPTGPHRPAREAGEAHQPRGEQQPSAEQRPTGAQRSDEVLSRPAGVRLAPAVLEVLSPGPFTTVQDLGRPGHAALGVGPGGAADRESLRLANRLVGNAESAAALELTYGGLVLRSRARTTVALAGAECPVRLDGRAVTMHGPVAVGPGQRLTVGAPARGLRTYLAVRGGLDVPPVLGSRATDTLSGIGPEPLRAGDLLRTGCTAVRFPPVDFAPRAGLPEEPVLRVVPGPREEWFGPEALGVLCSSRYEVTAESNRVGARLSGPPLEQALRRELPSEGMVRGALQVPPNGLPVLFLADHPVTGGYPVIAVVCAEDLDLAGQLRPGQPVRFTPFRCPRGGGPDGRRRARR